MAITDQLALIIDALDRLNKSKTSTYGLPIEDRVYTISKQLTQLADSGFGDLPIHICSSDEYDHTTGIPTVTNPEENIFYLVPNVDPNVDDMFVEYVYVNSNWELFGSGGGISGYLDAGDVSYNKSTEYLNGSVGAEINETKKNIGVEKLTNWIDGYYITLTGDTVDLSNPMRNTSWRCLYTVCSPGDVFTISGDGASPRLWGFVDSNYNILSKASANTVANNILITAPENTAYLVLNDKAKNTDSYKGMCLQQSLMAALSPIDDALSDANNATSNKIYLIKSPDNVQNLPFVNYPGLLITFANDVAKLQIFMQSSSVLFYRRHWSTSWESWHQVITIDQLEEATNKPKDNILSAYSNILCIGDSLTYSLVYTGKTSGGDDISRQAYVTYPVALQRKTGATCSSLGRAGISAATFWNEFNESIIEKENQLAIVYLGTNEGLTDTMDTDMQGDDYTLWSNTSTGCYGKIIAKLLSVGSKVVLVKVYSSSGDIDVTNNVIEAMANKFGVPFIENVRFADMKYHSWPDGTGYNYVHYNDLGYSVFADYLIYQVSNLETDDMKKILPE